MRDAMFCGDETCSAHRPSAEVLAAARPTWRAPRPSSGVLSRWACCLASRVRNRDHVQTRARRGRFSRRARMLGAAAHRCRADSMTACSLAARLVCRLQMPSRFNSVCIQSLHAISGENGILPQHGDGGCKLGCGGAGDGRVVGHGFKTRSLPTVSLHPGVLPSSPFLHAYMPACRHKCMRLRMHEYMRR